MPAESFSAGWRGYGWIWGAPAFGHALLGALLLSGCGPSGSQGIPDGANGQFAIDDDIFTLKAGRATRHYFPGSASVNELWLEGEPVFGDFDGDGVQDAAVIS